MAEWRRNRQHVILSMTWIGDRPTPGCFMKAERGRIAYEILDVHPVKGALKMLGARRLALRCLRWAPKDVPHEATMCRITWKRRSKRGG